MSKKNYMTMNHDELVSEKKRLNKKLILPNILIVIIAVVACLMQMMMPFLKVSVTLNSDVVASVVDTIYEDYGDDDPLYESDNAVVSSLLTKSNIKDMTASLNTTISLELKATDLLSLAFSSDDNAEEEIVSLLAGMIDNMNIKDEIETALNEMMPTVISTAVTAVVTEQLISSLADGEELTEEQTAAIETCASEIGTAVSKLSEVTTVTEEVKTEVKADVTTSVTTAMTDLGYTEEDIASISSEIDTYFDAFIDSAVDDEGNFSYLTLVENIDTLVEALSSGELSEEDYEDLIEDLTGGTGSDDEDGNTESGLTAAQEAFIISMIGEDAYNAMTDDEKQEYIEQYYNSVNTESYASGVNAIKYSLTADSTSSSDDDTSSSISYYLNLLDDSEALVRELLGDNLDHSTLQTIKTGALALFVFIVFVAALWAILAILALIHILVPNKKVAMWYVKLFGGLPSIIFYLVPALVMLFGSSAIVSMLGAEGSMIATVLGAISFGGGGLIILICLLALWIVSIFWCHPIKKRIKRCKKALKQAA